MEMEIATVETDLFEHRQVKPHFINDCGFGEDFAQWLRQRLANSGFESSNPIQKTMAGDYGSRWRKPNSGLRCCTLETDPPRLQHNGSSP